MSVAFCYQENTGETYSVSTEGFIFRPSMNMKPSGGWIFKGAANSLGNPQMDLPSLVSHLQTAGGNGAPFFTKAGKPRLHVIDVDHGTVRHHGAAITRIWLHPHAPMNVLELVTRAHEARQQEQRARWLAAENNRKRASPLYRFADEIESAIESDMGDSALRDALQGIVDEMRHAA